MIESKRCVVRVGRATSWMFLLAAVLVGAGCRSARTPPNVRKYSSEFRAGGFSQFDYGTFALYQEAGSKPVGWVYSADRNSEEVWALYAPNTNGGWSYPASPNGTYHWTLEALSGENAYLTPGLDPVWNPVDMDLVVSRINRLCDNAWGAGAHSQLTYVTHDVWEWIGP